MKIEIGDIREKSPDASFDIATLYNNIYYFPVAERVTLLKHVGSLGSEALNLWGAATSGAGRLPAEGELVRQLREAGCSRIKTKNLLPGDRFVAFQAFRS